MYIDSTLKGSEFFIQINDLSNDSIIDMIKEISDIIQYDTSNLTTRYLGIVKFNHVESVYFKSRLLLWFDSTEIGQFGVPIVDTSEIDKAITIITKYIRINKIENILIS